MSGDARSFVLPRFPRWSLPAVGVPILALAAGAAAEGHLLAAAGLAAMTGPVLWALTGAAVLTLDPQGPTLRVRARGAALGAAPQDVPVAEILDARADPIEDGESLALVVVRRDGEVRLCLGAPEEVTAAVAWVRALRQRPGRKSSAAASD
ncbi:MAG: hypothetical protein U0325_13440 [Polyangiales bacterium]